jgi:hypothetical protein
VFKVLDYKMAVHQDFGTLSPRVAGLELQAKPTTYLTATATAVMISSTTISTSMKQLVVAVLVPVVMEVTTASLFQPPRVPAVAARKGRGKIWQRL